jgi:hypothetical protein
MDEEKKVEEKVEDLRFTVRRSLGGSEFDVVVTHGAKVLARGRRQIKKGAALTVSVALNREGGVK